MSQMANISVFDGAATPVSHVFIGTEVTRGPQGQQIGKWSEQSLVLPDEAQARLTLTKLVLPSLVTRASLSVEVPIMEIPSGGTPIGYVAAPKVAYVERIDIIRYIHPRSTITGGRTVRGIAYNLLNNVSVSVAASTGGFVPEMLDLKVMPT